MPYDSITAAKDAGFPTNAEGVGLTLTQINKLAEIYDAVKEAGTAKNPMSVAWTQWKLLYKKTGNRWTTIKAAAVQFGTEQFVAAASRDTGIPEHAIQIEGRLIHLGKKNLAGWGVTSSAAEQIIQGIVGIPIRACADMDAHACDYAFDNKSHIGYGLHAWEQDDWIHAAAAITDEEAVKLIRNGTWTPMGHGGWSVAGIPTKMTPDFNTTGLVAGYSPTGISLVFAPSIPAFVGSGFDMVAAAVRNSTDHTNGETIMTDKTDVDVGVDDPITFTQEELDAAIAETTTVLEEKLRALETEKADAIAAKEKQGIDDLATQKLEYDKRIEMMTTEERAAYDAKLADMTPTKDVEKMIAAAVAQGQADTIETIERQKLTGEYKNMLAASVILSAPFMTDGVLDPEKIAAEMATVGKMKVAAISGLIGKAKLMAAAANPAAQSAFDAADVPGTAPGGHTTDADLLSDLNEMDNAVGRRI